MTSPLRFMIFGAGAVGGYIGSKLLTSGSHVLFIARGDRLRLLSEKGLSIRSSLGNSTHAVLAREKPDPEFSPEIIILACKAPALESALDVVSSCVGPNTRLLPFLNGVRHMKVLESRFPDAFLLGGIAHGALTLGADGAIHHLSPFLRVSVGVASAGTDPIAERIVSSLAAAHVEAHLSPTIHKDLWSKYVFLATLAGITCLMRASIGTIMASKEGHNLTRQLFKECLSVAHKEGFVLDSQTMSSYLNTLTEAGSPLTSSMLRDVEASKRTEWDHILGDMLSRAKLHNLQTPMLEICATHLACYETSLSRHGV